MVRQEGKNGEVEKRQVKKRPGLRRRTRLSESLCGVPTDVSSLSGSVAPCCGPSAAFARPGSLRFWAVIRCLAGPNSFRRLSKAGAYWCRPVLAVAELGVEPGKNRVTLLWECGVSVKTAG